MANRGGIVRINGSLTSGAAATETTLETPINYSRMWELVRVRFVRTAGSAANYTLRFGQATGWTNGDINQITNFATTAVATATATRPNPGIAFRTDANGRLYMRAGWDAGSDNAANYEVYLRLADGPA